MAGEERTASSTSRSPAPAHALTWKINQSQHGNPKCQTANRNYSPTYGSRAMKRARLIAWVTACWLAAEQPVLRRPTIRP